MSEITNLSQLSNQHDVIISSYRRDQAQPFKFKVPKGKTTDPLIYLIQAKRWSVLSSYSDLYEVTYNTLMALIR